MVPIPLIIKEAYSLRDSVLIQVIGNKVCRYFICIVKALTLPEDNLNWPVLYNEFKGVSLLGRHFNNVYIKYFVEKKG